MRLTMRLARAVAAIGSTMLLVVAAMGISYAVTDSSMTPASASPWAVMLGSSDRVLYPGVDARMPYVVENTTRATEVLHRTIVELKNDGVGMYDNNTKQYIAACRASWLRVTSNTVSAEVEIASGASINGTIGLK